MPIVERAAARSATRTAVSSTSSRGDAPGLAWRAVRRRVASVGNERPACRSDSAPWLSRPRDARRADDRRRGSSRRCRQAEYPRLAGRPSASLGIAPAWRRRCCAKARRSASSPSARCEPRPFTEQQIALLETFADQAVIAIENARLFEELERGTRRARRWSSRRLGEVLRVIASSPIDLQRVLDDRRRAAPSGSRRADGGTLYELRRGRSAAVRGSVRSDAPSDGDRRTPARTRSVSATRRTVGGPRDPRRRADPHRRTSPTPSRR